MKKGSDHVAKYDTQLAPKVVPLLLWPLAAERLQRIRVDYAEAKDQNFLVDVDSYSKWLEVFPLFSTTAVGLVTVLRSLLAGYLVSDKGPQFIADKFVTFLKSNGIEQTLCPSIPPLFKWIG